MHYKYAKGVNHMPSNIIGISSLDCEGGSGLNLSNLFGDDSRTTFIVASLHCMSINRRVYISVVLMTVLHTSQKWFMFLWDWLSDMPSFLHRSVEQAPMGSMHYWQLMSWATRPNVYICQQGSGVYKYSINMSFLPLIQLERRMILVASWHGLSQPLLHGQVWVWQHPGPSESSLGFGTTLNHCKP